MTPEQRSERASKAGQAAARKRRERAQAAEVAAQQVEEPQKKRRGRPPNPATAERKARAKKFTQASEPIRRAMRAEQIPAPGQHWSDAPPPEVAASWGQAFPGQPEDDAPDEPVVVALVAAMLDPPFVASPEGNKVRSRIVRRMVAAARAQGHTIS